MDAQWRIELLGGLRASRGEWTVTHFESRKSAALLACLAYHPHRTHSREALAEQLWPDELPDATRNRFKQVLSVLRRVLEPAEVPPNSVLIADRAHVRVEPQSVRTDVTEFEEALQRAARAVEPRERAVALEEAVALYRGELLPGFYQEWVLTERERLAAAYLDALDHLADALGELGELSRAIDCARRAVSADALREPARATLMRLLARAGRVPEAMRQFADLERVLREELGAAPAPATRQLLEDLRAIESRAKDEDERGRANPNPEPPNGLGLGAERRTPAAAPPVAPRPRPSRLAAPLTAFFGRDEEIERLEQLLAPASTSTSKSTSTSRTAGATPNTQSPNHPITQSRLITLLGPGGTGKTRLALETGRRLQQRYDGAVWFVPLASRAEARLMLEAVLDAMGQAPIPEAEPLDQVLTCLNAGPSAPAPALLVLDNFEQFLDDSATEADAPAVVRELLERAPALTCLLTSRRRLEIEGERVFPVLPLPTPAPGMGVSPDDLLAFPSVRLFVDRAQAADPEFQVTPGNVEAVRALCHRLDGIPLAIELAASWAGVMTPEQMLARLTQRFDLLVSRRKDLDPRHRSLRATLEWSFRQLPPELARFLACLSVFREGWTLGAAEAVIECLGDWVIGSEHPITQSLNHSITPSPLGALTELRARSLVLSEASGGEMRFRLLETVRDYAREQLGAEEEAVTRRHAEYFAEMADEARRHSHTHEEPDWFTRLDRDEGNIRAALDWTTRPGAAAEDAILALRIGGGLARYWQARGRFSEGRRWLAAALAHPAAIGEPRARGLWTAGLLAWEQQDGAEARRVLDESLSFYQETGDNRGAATVLNTLAKVMEMEGDMAGARALHEECLAHWQKVGGLRGIAAALHNLGYIACHQNDNLAARRYIEQCLAMHRQLGNVIDEAWSIGNLARTHRNLGEFPEALAGFQECIRRFVRLRHPAGMAGALIGVAWSLAEGSPEPADAELAVRLIGASEAARAAIGLPWFPEDDGPVAAARKVLGEAASTTARAAGAAMTLEEAVAAALAAELPPGVSRT